MMSRVHFSESELKVLGVLYGLRAILMLVIVVLVLVCR